MVTFAFLSSLAVAEMDEDRSNCLSLGDGSCAFGPRANRPLNCGTIVVLTSMIARMRCFSFTGRAAVCALAKAKNSGDWNERYVSSEAAEVIRAIASG